MEINQQRSLQISLYNNDPPAVGKEGVGYEFLHPDQPPE